MAVTNTLTWKPNQEPDILGYNVYRHIGNVAPVKINASLILHPTVTYVDTDTVQDGDYFYSVTAEDTAKNESAHSTEVDKVINQNPPAAPTGLTVV